MALIKCPECSNMVSSIAAACPHCGSPVSGAAEAYASGSPLTTVQQTSKKLKALTAIGAVIFFAGFIWLGVVYGRAHDQAFDTRDEFYRAIRLPAVVVGVGLLWTIVLRIRIWWHHG